MANRKGVLADARGHPSRSQPTWGISVEKGNDVRSIRRRGIAARGSGARSRRSLKIGIALTAVATALLAFAVSAMAGPGVTGTNLVTTPDTTPAGYTQPTGYTAPANDGLGVPNGAIKHVWVIIMENHAYESSFTGLNDNSYLAKTLPQDGAELTNYYGTGHSSLDNYTSMVSGQGPMTDDQADCPAYDAAAGNIDTSGGSLAANPNYGQFVSAAGPNAPAGDNGCVYPSNTPTLFNQLDANSTSYKVYAQDLTASSAVGSGATAGQNAGTQYCGAPDATPGASPSPTQTGVPSGSTIQGGSQPTDQYVAKHNPLPWFQSDLSSGDCANGHLASLFGPNDQLYSDLQNESTTPAMNFIIPDNCNNAHDSVCVGNNLSGGFTGQTPNSPINNVGGSYAGDLFLEHVIPEIMNSPAYSDGGLIAVVFDEAYPQFTYSADSMADSQTSAPTAYNSLLNDEAGQTLFGRSLNWEPSGPNVPNVQNQFGQQLSAGPGFNEYLDRPGNSTFTTTTPAGTVTNTNTVTSPLVPCSAGTNPGNGYLTVPADQCYLGGGDAGVGSEEIGSFTAAAATSGGMITQTISTLKTSANGGLVAPDDEGEQVTNFPAGVTPTENGATYTGNVYIGQVVAAPAAAISQTTTDPTLADQGSTASFQLVDANGNAVGLSSTSGSYAGYYALGGDESPGVDRFYDAFDGTTGGGDTGAVLLSPYIKGGTVSNNYYNHYSLLRSLEDIFQVSNGSGSATGYTGPINVSTGVDGAGHLGYAGQPGLAPLGTDVFTNSPSDATSTVTQTVTQTVSTATPVTYIVVPGTHTTIKVLEGRVPNLKNMTLSFARSILGYAALKLGRVTSPKAKKGYELVVAKQSIAATRSEPRNTKVNVTLVLKQEK
jgi:hypothetical protein